MRNTNMPDDAQKPETISYFLHQGMVYTQERYHKRIVVILCVVIVLLLAWAGTETVLRHVENQAWLAYLAQYDFTDYEYTQDGRGLNIIGDGNGVDYNGPAATDTDTDEEESQYGTGTGDTEAEVVEATVAPSPTP